MQKKLPTRKNIRLQRYDYSQAGYYFITICVKGGCELLGNVGANCVRPNLTNAGIITEKEIQTLSNVYENVTVDKYVIMPNHLHMIVVITKNGRTNAPTTTISQIIKQFKGSITKKLGFSLWQRSYHDHIIRRETDYQRICKYINENPIRWHSVNKQVAAGEREAGERSSPLRLDYTVSADESGISLLNFLKKKRLSRKTMVAIKHRGGQLLVNGTPQIVHHQLTAGDLVTVNFPKEARSESLIPEDLELDIIYEDEYLLVINKPAGIPVIPSIRYPSKTLANAIIYDYNKKNIAATVHFVNRLDRDTSGLLMVAKYQHIHHLLTKEMKQIKRKYYALVKGHLPATAGKIDQPIARERVGSVRRLVRGDGQRAITFYQVMEKKHEMTLVQCELETGRTHQIRVHLAYLGCPIIGDTLYDQEALKLAGGQMLHSYHLSFIHPITEKALCFETALPARFREQIK